LLMYTLGCGGVLAPAVGPGGYLHVMCARVRAAVRISGHTALVTRLGSYTSRVVCAGTHITNTDVPDLTVGTGS
jgi:hypothetical protein